MTYTVDITLEETNASGDQRWKARAHMACVQTSEGFTETGHTQLAPPRMQWRD